MTDPRLLSEEELAVAFLAIARRNPNVTACFRAHIDALTEQCDEQRADLATAESAVVDLMTECDRLRGLVERAREWFTNGIVHRYQGQCPDQYQSDARGPKCAVCDWLKEAKG